MYNQTVDRSLDFGTLNVSSLNISLGVKYEKSHNQSNLTTLEVTSMAQREILLLNKSYTIGNNTFRVLYGDRTCLILGNEIIKTGEKHTTEEEMGFTNCTLWFPYTSGYLSPPTCCEFLLVVLCGQNTSAFPIHITWCSSVGVCEYTEAMIKQFTTLFQPWPFQGQAWGKESSSTSRNIAQSRRCFATGHDLQTCSSMVYVLDFVSLLVLHSQRLLPTH
ncbi:hypothetical protein MRX96_045569 [Rhipicephalus microplus]